MRACVSVCVRGGGGGGRLEQVRAQDDWQTLSQSFVARVYVYVSMCYIFVCMCYMFLFMLVAIWEWHQGLVMCVSVCVLLACGFDRMHSCEAA